MKPETLIYRASMAHARSVVLLRKATKVLAVRKIVSGKTN